MDDNERLGQQKTDEKVAPARFHPYHSLLRLSQSLGHAATRALSNARGLVKTDRSFPSVSELFGINARDEKADTKKEDLSQMVTRSHEILASARTVFPLTIFPDDVVLDRSKVTIIMRKFFWVENVVSIRIEDILNVSAGVGPFFGSLNISSRVMNSIDHFPVNFLWRSDARRLKCLIQGYVISRHDKIDLSHLSKDELCATLMELGADH